jgi:hypothetical protein
MSRLLSPMSPGRRAPVRICGRPRLEPLEDRLVPALTLPNDPSLFVPVSMMAPLAMHIHAEVQIYLDGVPLVIPANVGVFGLAAYPLHTHDFSGLMHVESVDVRQYYVGDFFAIWNTTVLGHADLAALGAAPYLTVTQNGATSVGFGLVPIHDHDIIVVDALSANPTPAAAANQAFVSHLYTDLLHRPADTGGLVRFATELDQGVPRAVVVQTIMAGPEYRGLEIEGLYRTFLHRDADAGGLSGFLAFLGAGGTIQQVEARLLASPEYLQENGGTNSTFVAALYNDVLHRAADSAGAAAWAANLNAGQTRDQVAAGFVESREAEILVMQAIYQQYLHRAADHAGLATFLPGLEHSGSQELVIEMMLASDEYFRQG